MRPRHKAIQLRVKAVGASLLALFGILIVRSIDLQLVKGEVFRTLADRQQQRTWNQAPRRGEIVDRNGEKLAVSVLADSVYADPTEVEEADVVARKLAPLLHKPAYELKRLLRRDARFAWLARQVEPSTAAAVRALHLKGIHLTQEPKRYYPHGPLMGQTLGFVNIDSAGLEGIEKSYDTYVRGKAEVLALQRDATGRGLLLDTKLARLNGAGYSLELTVDKAIAWEAQKALDDAVARYQAANGVAVVQDVETGAILAIAISPPFDPNRYSTYPAGYGRNRVVADAYEPGSTFKALLLAAALAEGVVHENTLIDCEQGRYQVADRPIHDTKKLGVITASDVIKLSSNIGALKIGRMLGREKLYRYYRDFGVGEPTGIDLPAETPGMVRPLAKWNEVLHATAAYGQGIAVTPLQVVTAFSALANGGKLLRPFIVARVIDNQGGVVFENQPEVRRQVVSARVAARVLRVLERVVEEGGTGTLARIPGYSVAGKTGTAQKIDPVRGGYSREHYIASFAGVVPARDPRVAIYVSVNEPKGEIYGGTVAAPVFAAIAAKAMERLHVPPDLALPTEAVTTIADATLAAYPEEVSAAAGFAGLTMREVLRKAVAENVQVSLRGSGRATRARCANGRCEVYFEPL